MSASRVSAANCNTYHILRTCFWAGDTFAPKLLVKDHKNQSVPIQQYLQNAFLDMFEVLVKSVSDLKGVIGFEVGL